MTTRIIRYTSKPRARLSRIFADWQLMTALSITAVIIALNVSFPDLSDPSSQPLSTYQTRIPTIQFRNPIPKFVHLSYLNPKNGSYFKGNDDIYFIGFWVLIWFSFREILMKMFWRPIGTCCNLHLKSSRLQRFTEQGWSLAYCTTFWCMGMKILSAYPKPILAVETRQYWQGYPHDSLPALTKFYYLCQTAFWFQQMIVLNIEKQRKDHYQMLAHHIVSATLICVSYATNFTGLGVAIHTTMDFSDILLSLAKMLNYINAGWVCDTVYVIFVISWIYTRHYVFGKITWDIYSKIELDVPFYWKPEEGYMATRTLYLFFLILLCILQLLLIFWLALILKIMWGVVVGDGADDARSESDSGESHEEIEKVIDPKQKYFTVDGTEVEKLMEKTEERIMAGLDDGQESVDGIKKILSTPALEANRETFTTEKKSSGGGGGGDENVTKMDEKTGFRSKSKLYQRKC